VDFSIPDEIKPILDEMRGFMDQQVLPAEDEVLSKGWVESAGLLVGVWCQKSAE
jgi:hypothetical protein